MSNNISAGSVKKHYFLFLLTFILGRLLVIIPLFLLAIISFFLGYFFFIYRGYMDELLYGYIIIFGTVNVIFMIIRFVKNFPIELFNSFSAASGFQHSASYETEEFGANVPKTYVGHGGGASMHLGALWLYFFLKIAKISLTAPGYFIADSVCIILQVIAVTFSSWRYSDLVVILTQANGEPQKGDEIATISHMNEIKCKKMLLDMERFDWVIVGQRGFKMNTVMLKTFNPKYKEAPIIMSNFSTANQVENNTLKESHEQQMQEQEVHRLAEQQRLTEKFFSMTEKVD